MSEQHVYELIDRLSRLFLKAYQLGKHEYMFVGDENSELRYLLRTLVATLDEEDEQGQGKDEYLYSRQAVNE
jgi:hypothetical protein